MRFLKDLLVVLFALLLVQGQGSGTSLRAPYSSLYLLTAELGIQQLPQSERSRLQSRLQTLIGMAFQQATLLRLGTNNSNILQFQTSNPFTVQILSVEERFERGTQVDLVVLLQDSPVLAQAVAEDLSLLTLSHMSALLQYPVLHIGSKYHKDVVDGSRWWIIAILIGSGFLISLCGWALLFFYYNTCGRPVVLQSEEQNKPFDGDVTRKVERNMFAENLQTTAVSLSRPHLEEESEGQSTRLSPLPSLTPSVSPDKLDQHPHQKQIKVQVPSPKQASLTAAVVNWEEEQNRAEEVFPKEEVFLPQQRWTPYLAGDQVAAILAVSPQLFPEVDDHYPHPITTESGVLKLHARQCPTVHDIF